MSSASPSPATVGSTTALADRLVLAGVAHRPRRTRTLLRADAVKLLPAGAVLPAAWWVVGRNR